MLSPFDPVVWFRPRAERLFDFHYRIEIYTPEPEAQVRLLLAARCSIDDGVVGRIDLKSDRKAGVLRVQSAWTEPGAPAETAARLVPVLQRARPGRASTASRSPAGATWLPARSRPELRSSALSELARTRRPSSRGA